MVIAGAATGSASGSPLRDRDGLLIELPPRGLSTDKSAASSKKGKRSKQDYEHVPSAESSPPSCPPTAALPVAIGRGLAEDMQINVQKSG